MKRYWIIVALAQSTAAATQSVDLYDMSLEDLVNVEIISTAKFARSSADIPTAVTILEKQDIDAFGWINLADALRTLQGANITNDYSYTYAGFRGVSSSGDYISRMQVLINGTSLNENIYGSVNLDSAFQIDMNMIERIEIIRGPSASVYGSSSIFGVINVITRTGANINGTETRLAVANGESTYFNTVWGKQLDDGLDLSASMAVFNKEGQTGFFPELAAGNEVANIDNVDAEDGYKVSAQILKNGFRSSVSYMNRDKTIPNGSYGTIIGDLAHTESDTFLQFETGYEYNFSESTVWDNRLYYSRYQYNGIFPYDYEPDYVLNKDSVDGRWWGLESRVQTQISSSHYLTAGIEYRDNFHQEQENSDISYGCYETGEVTPCSYANYDSQMLSLYLQDEWTVTDALKLTMGLRSDFISFNNDDQPDQISPRIGAVYNHQFMGTFKYLYAEAYRNSTPSERFYNDPDYWGEELPALAAEEMQAHELTWGRTVFNDVDVLVSAYHFSFDNFIGEAYDGYLVNEQQGKSSGIEIEVQKNWSTGLRLRGNYSLQSVDYDDFSLQSQNVPTKMLKINLAYPMPAMDLIAGVELQAVSSRKTFIADNPVSGYGLVNMNLTYRPGNAWEIKARIQDVFNRSYADPIADNYWMAIPRDRIEQLGRNFRVEFSLFFN